MSDAGWELIDNSTVVLEDKNGRPLYRITDLGGGKINVSSCRIASGENNMTIEVDENGTFNIQRQNCSRVLKENAIKLDFKIIHELCLGRRPLCNKKAVVAQIDSYREWANKSSDRRDPSVMLTSDDIAKLLYYDSMTELLSHFPDEVHIGA